jgi:transposase-like protein
MEQVYCVYSLLTGLIPSSMHILEHFNTEAKSRTFVRKHVFNHGRARCLCCDVFRRFRTLGDGRYWCRHCRSKWSLKQLSGLSGTKLSFRQIAIVLYCFLNNHTLQAAMDMAEVSYPTVRRYYDILREKACVFVAVRSKDKLFGDIAVDACYVGKQRNNNQAIVLGAVQKDYKHIALRIVPQEEQGYVEKFLHDTVEKRSHILHDGHLAYNDLGWCGYTHETELHALSQFVLTSAIERIWALFKTFIRRRYHHVTKEKLQGYLTEFQFKFLYKKTHKNPLTFIQFLTTPVPSA